LAPTGTRHATAKFFASSGRRDLLYMLTLKHIACRPTHWARKAIAAFGTLPKRMPARFLVTLSSFLCQYITCNFKHAYYVC